MEGFKRSRIIVIICFILIAFLTEDSTHAQSLRAESKKGCGLDSRIYPGAYPPSVDITKVRYHFLLRERRAQLSDRSAFKISPKLKQELKGVPSLSEAVSPSTTIDVLIGFTPNAALSAGSETNVMNQASTAIDRANTALRNSNIPAKFRIVRYEKLTQNETGDPERDIEDLRKKTDGKWDIIHSERDSAKADLVFVVVSKMTGYTGYANVLRRNDSNPAENRAFGLGVVGAIVNDYILAHELGHNLGMQHDVEHVKRGEEGYDTYSFGHKFGSYRSIMAYAPGNIVPYFSNPSISYAGYPTGIGNQRDNAKTALNTIRRVASYRGNSQVTPTATPTRTATPVKTILPGKTPTAISTPISTPLPMPIPPGSPTIHVSLSGSVIDLNGVPFQAQRVSITTADSNGSLTTSSTTDSYGRFQVILSVRPGVTTYNIFPSDTQFIFNTVSGVFSNSQYLSVQLRATTSSKGVPSTPAVKVMASGPNALAYDFSTIFMGAGNPYLSIFHADPYQKGAGCSGDSIAVRYSRLPNDPITPLAFGTHYDDEDMVVTRSSSSSEYMSSRNCGSVGGAANPTLIFNERALSGAGQWILHWISMRKEQNKMKHYLMMAVLPSNRLFSMPGAPMSVLTGNTLLNQPCLDNQSCDWSIGTSFSSVSNMLANPLSNARPVYEEGTNARLASAIGYDDENLTFGLLGNITPTKNREKYYFYYTDLLKEGGRYVYSLMRREYGVFSTNFGAPQKLKELQSTPDVGTQQQSFIGLNWRPTVKVGYHYNLNKYVVLYSCTYKYIYDVCVKTSNYDDLRDITLSNDDGWLNGLHLVDDTSIPRDQYGHFRVDQINFRKDGYGQMFSDTHGDLIIYMPIALGISSGPYGMEIYAKKVTLQ